jgi:5-methylcytosine-specific restriction endonuclease McrA
MKSYRFIKDLVFNAVHKTHGKINYDSITALVKAEFPESKWQKTHWTWYCSQIRKGKYKQFFTVEERQNLNSKHKETDIRQLIASEIPAKKEANVVKHIGDEILNYVRFTLQLAAKNDSTLYFKLNRWVYSRLMQYEIQLKKPIKQALWDSGIRSCQNCGKEFPSIKGVEIHRKDGSLGYSKENCELLCRPCHQQNLRERPD